MFRSIKNNPCISAFILLSTVSFAQGAAVTWLLTGTETVQEWNQIQPAASQEDTWSGKIVETGDPYIVLEPCKINADLSKYLALKMALKSGAGLQIFFEREGFKESDSVRTTVFAGCQTPKILIFDFSEVRNWWGTVERIRIDFEGIPAGESLMIGGLGVAEQPIVSGEDTLLIDLRSPDVYRRERMAAHHETFCRSFQKGVSSAGILGRLQNL